VASLDPASSTRVLELIRSICADSQIPAVVRLHQVELASAFADRIIGIAHGRVVFDGPPSILDEAALEAIYGAAAGDRPRTEHEPQPVPTGIAGANPVAPVRLRSAGRSGQKSTRLFSR